MKLRLMHHICFLLFLFIGSFHTCLGQEAENHDVASAICTELGFTFSHFEQQVKSEIGGDNNPLLIEDTNLSFGLLTGYKMLDWLSAGIYIRYDNGKRKSSFLSSSPGPITVISVGGVKDGKYSEFWLGPYVRGHYKKLYLSVGYDLIGNRFDEGRPDIPSVNGDSDAAFSLDPSVALLFNLGGSASVTKHLEATFGIEYRARYYNQRGGNPLIDNVVLGTQNVTPLMGLRYNW